MMYVALQDQLDSHYTGRADDLTPLGLFSTLEEAQKVCMDDLKDIIGTVGAHIDPEEKWEENQTDWRHTWLYSNPDVAYCIYEVGHNGAKVDLAFEPTKIDVAVHDLPKHILVGMNNFGYENRSQAIEVTAEGEVSVESALDAYLKWEGIIGYTSRIMDLIMVATTKGKRS